MAIQGSINALIGTVLGANAFKPKEATPIPVTTPNAPTPAQPKVEPKAKTEANAKVEPIKIASQKGVEQGDITTQLAPSVTNAMVNRAMYGRLNVPNYDYQATTFAMQKMAENGQAKFNQRKASRNRIKSKKGGNK